MKTFYGPKSEGSAEGVGWTKLKEPRFSNVSGKFISDNITNAFNDSIKLEWSSSPNASRYSILYSEKIDSITRVKSLLSADTTAKLNTTDGFAKGVKYYFQVLALNVLDNYDTTFAIRSAIDSGFMKLPKPSKPILTNSSKGVLISWDSVDNAESFKIEYSFSSSIS